MRWETRYLLKVGNAYHGEVRFEWKNWWRAYLHGSGAGSLHPTEAAAMAWVEEQCRDAIAKEVEQALAKPEQGE